MPNNCFVDDVVLIIWKNYVFVYFKVTKQYFFSIICVVLLFILGIQSTWCDSFLWCEVGIKVYVSPCGNTTAPATSPEKRFPSPQPVCSRIWISYICKWNYELYPYFCRWSTQTFFLKTMIYFPPVRATIIITCPPISQKENPRQGVIKALAQFTDSSLQGDPELDSKKPRFAVSIFFLSLWYAASH